MNARTTSRAGIKSAILLAWVAAAGWMGAAELTVTPSEQVGYVACNGAQNVQTFTVTNYGSHPTNIAPVIHNTWPGWTCTIGPSPFTLGASSSTTVTARATPPAGAAIGSSASIELQFWTGATQFGTSYITTIIVPELQVTPPEVIGTIAATGASNAGVFTLRSYALNPTNIAVVIDNAWPGWSCGGTPSTFTINPGASTNITVTATPPGGLPGGTSSSMAVQFWGASGGCFTTNYLTTIIASAPTSGMAITSFPGNGSLSWTNAATGMTCRIEWAASLTSDWHRTWQGLEYLGGTTNRNFSTQVPMFYRIAQGNLPYAGMVLVDIGAFQMGDSYEEGFADEQPVHTVNVDAFWIDRYEVTKELWDRARAVPGYTDLPAGTQGWVNGQPSSDRGEPVVEISWYDAVKWCNARSQLDGLIPVYYTSAAQTTIYRSGQIDLTPDCVKWDANGYRLPTEAEREKAERGTLVGHHFPWPSLGGSYSAFIDGTKANYAGSGCYYEGTTRVGYFNGSQAVTNGLGAYLPGEDMANTLGLYDMAGNVGEWCWDIYNELYYSMSPATNPRGLDSGSDRVIRDGSWKVWGGQLRCAARFSSTPIGHSNDVGLRCVRGR